MLTIRPYALERFLPFRDRREAVRRLLEDKWRTQRVSRQFRITGESMGPDFDGRLVTVRFCPIGVIARGELVYIRRRGKRFVHRYVRRIGPFVIERGDANRYYGLHFARDILGRVTESSGPGS